MGRENRDGRDPTVVLGWSVIPWREWPPSSVPPNSPCPVNLEQVLVSLRSSLFLSPWQPGRVTQVAGETWD